jgi:hypothetical protein
MLRTNPLQPPRPFFPAPPAREPLAPSWEEGVDAFVSAEDFDRTGILTGVDPCESRYWWLPELYGPDLPAPGVVKSIGGSRQATSRSALRPTAAA